MRRNLLNFAPRSESTQNVAIIDGIRYEGAAAIAAVRNYQQAAETFENPPQAPAKVDVMNLMLDWEGGDISEADEITLFQALIDQRLLGHLQGAYHRRAMTLWANGLLADLGGRRRPQPEGN
jgi:hypothetical protein